MNVSASSDFRAENRLDNFSCDISDSDKFY